MPTKKDRLLTPDLAAKTLSVTIVIVTCFEPENEDAGSDGEFRRWKSRLNLDTRIPAPHLPMDIYANEKTGIIGIVTGMGTTAAAAGIMGLGLHPALDLSNAYWIVAGIAGINPNVASLGSVALATWLVDGDLSFDIDPREMPDNWTTGKLPLFARKPFDPSHNQWHGEVYQLNNNLVNLAFELVKDCELNNSPELASTAHAYPQDQAKKPPFVLKGDNLASQTFYHGIHFNEWAEQWVAYWTKSEGTFVTSAMEDTGIIHSLTCLDRLGKVNKNRLLVLRAASNFTCQPPGKSAAGNLASEQDNDFSGLAVALENVFLIGNRIVKKILHNEKYFV